MCELIVFNHVSIDGFFVDSHGDMSWAHRPGDDAEWNTFVNGNASAGGEMIYGRVTYELMAGWWPTEMAIKSMPLVAKTMNDAPKIVFSKTLKRAEWSNTRLVKGDLEEEIRSMKRGDAPTLVIFGSGTIVSQLAEAGLVDEYQLVVNPVALGQGRSLFATVKQPEPFELISTRTFGNGNVLMTYRPR